MSLERFFKSKGQLSIRSQWSSNKSNCYLRGCFWSPNGQALLVNCEDNFLRVFEKPLSSSSSSSSSSSFSLLTPIHSVKEPECIYDFSWHPKNSNLFASTSRSQPIHLYKVGEKDIHATYRVYDAVDEVCSANSLCFNPSGDHLYVGLKKGEIRIFDVSSPGRDSISRKTISLTNFSLRQRGIISSISVHPYHISLYACGSFDGTVALYAEPFGKLVMFIDGHSQGGGVSQVEFSPDGTHLLSGTRKDDEILVWDLRSPQKLLFSLSRNVETHQKFTFSLFDSFVLSGSSESGRLVAWNLKGTPIEDENGNSVLPSIWNNTSLLHNDCINCVAFHPFESLLASTSGQRHFPSVAPCSDDFFTSEFIQRENSLKIWNCGENI